jgi:hypothetical protein
MQPPDGGRKSPRLGVLNPENNLPEVPLDLSFRFGKEIEKPGEKKAAYGSIDNPVPGSHQYIPECARGVITGIDRTYNFKKLPSVRWGREIEDSHE